MLYVQFFFYFFISSFLWFSLSGLVVLEKITFSSQSKIFSSFDLVSYVNSSASKSLLEFVLILFFLNFVLCAFSSVISLFLVKRKERRVFVSILVYFTVSMFVVSLNSKLYPHSIFSFSNTIVFHLSLPALLLLSVYSFVRIYKDNIILTCSMISMVVLAAIVSYSTNDIQQSHRQPNIIIIGLDSFRQDIASNENLTPSISGFIDNSIFFENAYTSIARTFPSWISILSGQYPASTGVRFNLTNANENLTFLPQILGRVGYKSIYATDEARFSNIDEKYGFDDVITPEIGVNDFIIGSMSDNPLVNVFSGSFLGGYLFPAVHANRAAYKTYQPSDFSKRLSSKVESKEKPAFIATHFCLAHWPYKWAGSRVFSSSLEAYKENLQQLDVQFNDYMELLQSRGYLKNSIVIVLSDHGETFSSDIQQFVSENGLVSISGIGHGTNIISRKQNEVIISVQAFKNGDEVYDSKTISQYANLVDVMPTVLDLISADEYSTGGISLKPWIENEGTEEIYRYMPLESGYTPEAIKKGIFDPQKIAEASAGNYEISPSGRLLIKESAQTLMLENKQRGVLFGDEITLFEKPIVSDGKRVIKKINYHDESFEVIDIADFKYEDTHKYFCTYFNRDEYIKKNKICDSFNLDGFNSPQVAAFPLQSSGEDGSL